MVCIRVKNRTLNFFVTNALEGYNLLREDIKEGYTDYVLWSTFKPESLDIDGELDMECLDSGMLLIKESSPANNGELISEILQQAYDNQKLNTILLLK